MKMMIKLTAKTIHKMALRKLLEETQKYLTVGDFFVLSKLILFLLCIYLVEDFLGSAEKQHKTAETQVMINVLRL